MLFLYYVFAFSCVCVRMFVFEFEWIEMAASAGNSLILKIIHAAMGLALPLEYEFWANGMYSS